MNTLLSLASTPTFPKRTAVTIGSRPKNGPINGPPGTGKTSLALALAGKFGLATGPWSPRDHRNRFNGLYRPQASMATSWPSLGLPGPWNAVHGPIRPIGSCLQHGNLVPGLLSTFFCHCASGLIGLQRKWGGPRFRIANRGLRVQAPEAKRLIVPNDVRQKYTFKMRLLAQ
ncbi:predicted protein [Histoplasma mississippiense (nom. inval.)]|uniref:predicted protein n=1 Tax=Ajellomyces capsulatus (strain NAm1 / WU24) TaxID=2059318 RepID=UPI000157BEB4|nr:predicted protein [Histoplasma mississippiense (nom. inval.)]EDN06467.1 predicted protein [Histoplasma mississippiense (nom. inval.)]